MRNNKRRKDECSSCRGNIEANRVASGQKFCKECQRIYQNAYRKKKNYLTIGKNTKAKHYARTYANTYLRRGKLKKMPCEVCGDTEVEMHHSDYSKPLEVRWLCRNHHMEDHKKSNNVF